MSVLRSINDFQPASSADSLMDHRQSSQVSRAISSVAREVPPQTRLAVIEHRPLARDCLIASISEQTGWSISGYASLDDWLQSSAAAADVVLLSCAAPPKQGQGATLFKSIAEKSPESRIVVLCDDEELDPILQTIEAGAAGYIPTSLPLSVAMEAIRLVLAGGIYLPAASLFSERRSGGLPKATPQALVGIFTKRQVAVIDGLCKGKLNKVIAHELKMRESTVKVHVRNIMKKLNARTRTEVAYIISDLLSAGPKE